jgi:ABC-type lipoprotein release transport system permease subunit
MCLHAYLLISGIIFGLVAILHLVRLVRQLPAQLGSKVLPMWISWGGLVFATVLCVWAFVLFFHK